MDAVHATAGCAPAASHAAGRAAWIALAVGVGAVVAYFAVPTSFDENWYVAIGLASVIAIVVGVRRNRPARAAGWYLLAGANLAFVVGDEVGNAYSSVTGHEPPVPSIADLFYLSGYPLLIAGVVLLARAAGIAATRDHRVDAAVITLGAFAVGWEPLVASSAAGAGGLLGRVVAVAYPVMDVGVLFIVVGTVISARSSTPALRLVAMSIVAMLVADVVYASPGAEDAYRLGDPLDAGWLFSYVLVGVAALHPSAGRSAPDAGVSHHVHPRRWIVVVSVAAFVPLALLLARAIDMGDPGFAAPVGFSIATFAFVGVRAVLLFGHVGRQAGELAAQAESLRTALAAQQTLEADLRHRAYHDDLTGLPNRAWIRDRLDDGLADPAGVTLCLADLDRFKAVNDTLGHRIGDQVLVAVARRLTARPDDGVVVGRLGGDEFACVLPGTDPRAAARTAQWIVDSLREPIEVDGRRIQLSVSVGVAVSDATSTPATLPARADTAMYVAKNAGRDRWRSYEPAMGVHLVEQLTITNAFADALPEEQFSLLYQPVFQMTGGSLEGFEALVRWHHPSLGPITPERFVPLAEETGFVVPLGRWVLQTACRAAAGWPGRTTVAVNVSARQLADPGIVTDVASALVASGLPADRLVLEITESAIMDDVEQSAAVLGELKALGAVLAIDDFGTGHSSLSHLRDLPVDVLKIDRSFVAPLVQPSRAERAFVRAIVDLARALGMRTVAEGVEVQTQYDVLQALGCDTVQGYLTGRPTPAEDARRAALASA